MSSLFTILTIIAVSSLSAVPARAQQEEESRQQGPGAMLVREVDAGPLSCVCIRDRSEVVTREVAPGAPEIQNDTTMWMSCGCMPESKGAAIRHSGGAEPTRATGTRGMGGAQLTVTNPMPHPMFVIANWGNPRIEAVLGVVSANDTKTFDLAAPEGTKLSLKAIDPKRTHQVAGSVTLPTDAGAASWTIR